VKGRVDFGGAARKITDAARVGLGDAGEHLLEESRRLVPHEEGTLERSSGVDQDGDVVTVWYDQPYAVAQHEDRDLRHDPGRQAKYLEQPLVSERPTLLALIAARIRRDTR
jgi:hypothetical protein